MIGFEFLSTLWTWFIGALVGLATLIMGAIGG